MEQEFSVPLLDQNRVAALHDIPEGTGAPPFSGLAEVFFLRADSLLAEMKKHLDRRDPMALRNTASGFRSCCMEIGARKMGEILNAIQYHAGGLNLHAAGILVPILEQSYRETRFLLRTLAKVKPSLATAI